jgi:hypothetical protein
VLRHKARHKKLGEYSSGGVAAEAHQAPKRVSWGKCRPLAGALSMSLVSRQPPLPAVVRVRGRAPLAQRKSHFILKITCQHWNTTGRTQNQRVSVAFRRRLWSSPVRGLQKKLHGPI